MKENSKGETRNTFCRLVDTAPLMICLLDKQFQGLYFNKEWLAFSGRAEWELLADQWQRYIHPVDREPAFWIFQKSLEKHQKFDVEFRLKGADGQFYHVRNIGVPRISEDGKLEEYINTTVNITSSKWAEDATRDEGHLTGHSLGSSGAKSPGSVHDQAKGSGNRMVHLAFHG